MVCVINHHLCKLLTDLCVAVSDEQLHQGEAAGDGERAANLTGWGRFLIEIRKVKFVSASLSGVSVTVTSLMPRTDPSCTPSRLGRAVVVVLSTAAGTAAGAAVGAT